MKSKRLEPIRDIAATGAHNLRLAMADAQQRVSDMELQLAQLQGFHQDYLQKATAVEGPMDTVRLQNNRAFLERLADAIRAQLQKIGIARADYEARRALWSDKRVEAEAIGQAVERFRTDERQAADRRDQRESDETGLRLWLAARGPAEP
jgi:flagellar protein FliJ